MVQHIGTHLLIDFWGVKPIENKEELEAVLRKAAEHAESEALDVCIRTFEPQGITGVIILAESHISIHSWPELEYVAIDVFTCGTHTKPHKALEYLKTVYDPQKIAVQEAKRGGKKNNVISIDNQQYFLEQNIPGSTVGTRHLFPIKKCLYTGKSDFQEIAAYQTNDYGNMLTLDGIIQTSEQDEFIYHENICHLPMFYHTNPQHVLIIGGGDGGSLREILKHNITKVTMVEIDKQVVETSKAHLPALSQNAFEHKKAELIIGDGYKYITKHQNEFDVIVLDLSDPEGPAELLITEQFYAAVKKALKPGGIISIQSASLTEQPKIVTTINKRLKKIFSSVKIHQFVIPTYGTGIFSITVASDTNLETIAFEQIEKKYNKINTDLKYYTPEMHFASAVLPKYVQELLKGENLF